MPKTEEKKCCMSCDHVETVHDEKGCVGFDEDGNACFCKKWLEPPRPYGLPRPPRTVPQNRFKDVGNGNWQVLGPDGKIIRSFNDGGHQVGFRDLGD